MQKKKSKIITNMIFGIIKSGLLSFVIYLASSVFFNIVVYKEDYVSKRDFTPVYIGMIFFYAIANYLVYIRQQSDNKKMSVESTVSFNLKNDFISYIKEEGKYLLIIYGAMAIVLETSLILKIWSILAALSIVFPTIGIFVDKFQIPIVRSVVAYTVTILLILALTMLDHYRVYKLWKTA